MKREMDQITTNIRRDQDKKMVELITEALKEHGFEFETRLGLNDFIRDYCNAIESEMFTRYYVKGVPFFYAENQFNYTRNKEGTAVGFSQKYAIIKPGANV